MICRGRPICRSTPRPISASPASSIPRGSSPRGRSAITWATTAWPTSSPSCGSSTSTIGRDAIWPFTVVGRPPQEDTIFGQLIHELAGPAIPKQIPGVQAVHAVDAAGVHPLLLAIGSERYVPYDDRRRPRELLTLANALLGHGQLSLAKYLWIVAAEDNPALDVRNVADFFRHVLERVDWRRDLHFQTCTTIDTLDYSSGRLNEGSKVVIAAAGPRCGRCRRRSTAGSRCPKNWDFAGRGWFCRAFWWSKGRRTRCGERASRPEPDRQLPTDSAKQLRSRRAPINGFPLVVVVDRERFRRRRRWRTSSGRPSPGAIRRRTFTASSRSWSDKHWGCRGSLVIDARAKPHHAPPLVEDPAVTRRVDALAAPGGPLHGVI